MARTPHEPDPGTGPLALFAAEHRRYRRRAGITQAVLAADLNYTAQFVGMIEVAARTPCRRYVEGADRILEADGGLTNCWELVSRLHIPKWFGPFIEVEALALTMRAWEIVTVPGLLQTPDYARAVLRADRPCLSEAQIEHEVDVRMQRQEVLGREEPPMFWAVIDESALRRVAGSREVMHAQYARLVELADLPHVVLQVLPFKRGMHTGQMGAFEILELGDQPEIIWQEGQGGGYFIDRPDQVAECARKYDYLRAMALCPAESKEFITALMEDPWSPPMASRSGGGSPATAREAAATV